MIKIRQYDQIVISTNAPIEWIVSVSMDGVNSLLQGKLVAGSIAIPSDGFDEDCDLVSIVITNISTRGLETNVSQSDGSTIIDTVELQTEETLTLNQQSVTIDFDGNPAQFISSSQKGGAIQFINTTHPGSNLKLNLNNGEIILAASCTGGNAEITGIGTLQDNSAGTSVIKTGLIEASQINSRTSLIPSLL